MNEVILNNFSQLSDLNYTITELRKCVYPYEMCEKVDICYDTLQDLYRRKIVNDEEYASLIKYIRHIRDENWTNVV